MRQDSRPHSAELDPCLLKFLDQFGILDADAPEEERPPPVVLRGLPGGRAVPGLRRDLARDLVLFDRAFGDLARARWALNSL